MDEQRMQQIEEAMQRFRDAHAEAKAAGDRAAQAEQELRELLGEPSEAGDPTE